ncbi:TPA: hypothetical protein ACH3X3_009503 [Trebouxia sp. C0006]
MQRADNKKMSCAVSEANNLVQPSQKIPKRPATESESAKKKDFTSFNEVPSELLIRSRTRTRTRSWPAFRLDIMRRRTCFDGRETQEKH